MRVTLIEDGIYGQAGDVVELGMKKAIEMGLVSTKESITTTTEETPDEVATKINKKNRR